MTAFLEELRRVAVVLSDEERRLRQATQARVEAIAERRRRAHRRWHLLAAAVDAARTGGEPAALAFLLAEFGLPADAELRAASVALAAAVAAAVAGDAAADPVAALDVLEAWHRGRAGGDLLSPAQTETLFQPPVDF